MIKEDIRFLTDSHFLKIRIYSLIGYAMYVWICAYTVYQIKTSQKNLL